MRNHNRALFVSIAALIIYSVGFVIFIFYSLSSFAYADFYKRLHLRCNLAAEQIFGAKPEDNWQWTEDYVEKLANQKEYFAEIDTSGKRIKNYGFVEEVWRRTNIYGPTEFQDGHQFYYSDRYYKDGKIFVVGVSAQNYFYDHHLDYLRKLLVISLVFGVLLAIVISLLVNRSFINPVYRIIQQVESIGSTNLHQRLPLSPKNNILDTLSATFNDMLNRIETSFETQKNFISNASHELNTPLTSIIGSVDLALSKERSPEEYRASLQKILTAAESLEKKTNALLLLARTGYGTNSANFTPQRIDQVILDSEQMVRHINEDFVIKTDFSLLPEDSSKLKVNGISSLLQLALSNIISNACKYSADHTCYIALGVSDRSVVIVVKDYGIGIPEGDLKFIYDPYYRASNTDSFSGFGIGLPLSRNIVVMHGGTLQVTSTLHVGTEVQVELPLYTGL